MDKGTLVDQIGVARENLKAEGIRACYFLQFGYPGETWRDIQKTIALVDETRPDDIGVSVSYPLPGTRFYDRVRVQLGKKTNWSDSEDLSMMFRGAYTDEFYRALHDALHTQVDAWHSDDKEASPTHRDRKYEGSSVGEVWARVTQLEKTCRNPDPTMLEEWSADPLVQLQAAPGPSHGGSASDGPLGD
jgi:anaerobic magnesium-protoporphyrin IX monomethyl ester cyclase